MLEALTLTLPRVSVDQLQTTFQTSPTGSATLKSEQSRDRFTDKLVVKNLGLCCFANIVQFFN